ncbi:hypothetical protein W97_08693 [Coniosporium apollinis CBS 100218]|uniref:NUDE domain-containing protein n=1 Tax=Coniosporium apollinis (strain CBS 100218) TaxID=1168221 RepID=R7Z5Q0_CONA1|nr:uncharacterized protein W97_08693 [Coniosporium apollinis CBS 100218]EON69433.1 hypothetical protein W97_08693 [Coniosporium apollinis CBS 100218]
MSLTFALQALLVRHESYMADAEQERVRMSATIEQLERDKRELEARNAQTIEENRSLLDQLEYLNNTVSESDDHIKSLTATLRSTQQELQRLTLLESRTRALERQLAELETEQASLHETLAMTTENERSAVMRWRKAERTIAELQDQVDRIEREAREERERHVEAVGRMEWRRAVEQELEADAGKGKTGGMSKNRGDVVSHFVKDILQDNANLQLGVVELRELLLNSNEEVERLREQLMLHQPVGYSADGNQTPTLREELGFEPVLNQALHVHHHYHAPATAPGPEIARGRTTVQRRVKKKRNVASPGIFSPSGQHIPRSEAPAFGRTAPALTPAIATQTAVTTPQRALGKDRWSTQSSQTGPSVASSVPSSPYASTNRTSSFFDRVFSDATQDSSSPTSPDGSEPPDSPVFEPLQIKCGLTGPLCGFSAPGRDQLAESAAEPAEGIADGPLNELQTQAGADKSVSLSTPKVQATIPEETSDVPEPEPPPPPFQDLTGSTDYHTQIRTTRPPLRRAASHESLLSLHCLDIPTLPSRPPYLLATSSFTFKPSIAPVSTAAALSSGPILSATTATAARPAVPRKSDARSLLLAGGAVEQRGGVRKRGSDRTLGQKVGGWVWGRWSGGPASAPAPASTLVRVAASASEASVRKENTSATPGTPVKVAQGRAAAQSLPDKVPRPRPLGVNQSGSVLGLGSPLKVPCQVTVEGLDVEALRESLGDG